MARVAGEDKVQEKDSVSSAEVVRKFCNFFFFTSRDEFNELIPQTEANNTDEIELKPSIKVYHVASHYLLIVWKTQKETEESRERLENLCRYLLTTIESESIKLSYIGVALNKDHSLAWIRHIKQLLYKCCSLMDTLKPETHRDAVTLALILRTLVAFTCPNSWAILRSKQLSVMKPAMQQYCNNILGFLIQKGFFLSLRVSYT